MRRIALLPTILALLTAALGSGGAVAEGNVKDPAIPTTHFAGVPPRGTHASTPTTGTLLLSFSVEPVPHLIWNVYADGRVIWQQWSSSGDPIVIPRGVRMIDAGYVQQRLTPQGLQLLRARILSTGLFERSLRLRGAGRHAVLFARVRRGDRMVTLTAWPSGVAWREHPTNATAAQERGLAQIRALLADTAAWSLPAAAWADRKVREFVPSRYVFAFDRGVPDLTKLPPPLLPYEKLFSHGANTCQIVTTGELRTVLRAFLEAGITPVSNHADWLAFVLEGLRGSPSGPHFSPVLPSDSPC